MSGLKKIKYIFILIIILLFTITIISGCVNSNKRKLSGEIIYQKYKLKNCHTIYLMENINSNFKNQEVNVIKDNEKITFITEEIKVIKPNNIKYKNFNPVPDSAKYKFNFRTGRPGANTYYSLEDNKLYIIYRSLYPNIKMQNELYFKTLEISMEKEFKYFIMKLLKKEN